LISFPANFDNRAAKARNSEGSEDSGVVAPEWFFSNGE